MNNLCPTLTPATARARIEPMLLPPAGSAADECAGCAQPLTAERQILCGGGERPGSDFLRPPRVGPELVRHRWTVGHQAAFAVWRQLAQDLRELSHDPDPGPELVQRAVHGYDNYSLLLLYAGSCTSAQYATSVRQDMAACHPAFSGQWAPDHTAVPPLCREVRSALAPEITAPLTEAVKRNQRIHAAVAAHLVPDGPSLLRGAGRRPGSAATPGEHALYDAFFQVRRTPVCQTFLQAQLVRRCAQILQDLAAWGLYPRGTAPPQVTGVTDDPNGDVERLRGDAHRLLATLAGRLHAQDPLPLLLR